MANKRDLTNVNVTLEGSGSDHEKLLGKEFPCPVCGAVMLIRLTFKQKPYCHYSSCVLQIFFRGKLAIQRLTEVIESGVLISGSDSSTHKAITLYNRLQLLKTQKLKLEEKRPLFLPNEDLEKAILVFKNEIERVKTHLNELSQLGSGDKR